MLDVKITRTKDGLLASLAGAISEDARSALDGLLREIAALPAGAAPVLECAGIDFINSPGVALWMGFVTRAEASHRLRFKDCSIYFVDYINMTQTLVGSGEILSFDMPFRCASCARSVAVRLQTHDVVRTSSHGDPACPACGKKLTPEVEPSDYLAFLFP